MMDWHLEALAVADKLCGTSTAEGCHTKLDTRLLIKPVVQLLGAPGWDRDTELAKMRIERSHHRIRGTSLGTINQDTPVTWAPRCGRNVWPPENSPYGAPWELMCP